MQTFVIFQLAFVGHLVFDKQIMHHGREITNIALELSNLMCSVQMSGQVFHCLVAQGAVWFCTTLMLPTMLR